MGDQLAAGMTAALCIAGPIETEVNCGSADLTRYRGIPQNPDWQKIGI